MKPTGLQGSRKKGGFSEISDEKSVCYEYAAYAEATFIRRDLITIKAVFPLRG